VALLLDPAVVLAFGWCLGPHNLKSLPKLRTSIQKQNATAAIIISDKLPAKTTKKTSMTTCEKWLIPASYFIYAQTRHTFCAEFPMPSFECGPFRRQTLVLAFS
jgi:hypothetical protein